MFSTGRCVAAVLATAALLLAGCQSEIGGRAGLSAADQQKVDRKAEERAALDQALRELAQQRATAYRIAATDGVESTISVTRNGTALGTIPAKGQQIRMFVAGEGSYVHAPVAYWQGRGPRLDRFADRWVKTAALAQPPIDTKAALSASAASNALQAGLSKADPLADPVRSRLPDGTEVFELRAPDGTAKVTTAAPHRFVSFEAGLLGAETDKAFERGYTLRPTALAGDALTGFRTDLEKAAGEVATAGEPIQDRYVEVADNKLDCGKGDGSCVTTVQVRTSVPGPTKSSVKVNLKVTVNADGLGARDCGAEAVAPPSATTPLSCSVVFSLPNTTGSARVVSLPSISAELVQDPATTATITQAIQTEFAGLN